MKWVLVSAIFLFSHLCFSQDSVDATVELTDGFRNPWTIALPEWVRGSDTKSEQVRNWIEVEFEREFGRSPREITNMDELLNVVNGVGRFSDWFSRVALFGLTRGAMGGLSGAYATYFAGATFEEAKQVFWLYGFVSFCLGFFNQEIQDFVLTGGEFHRSIQRRLGLKSTNPGIRVLRRFEEIFRSFVLEKVVVWSQAAILIYVTSQPNEGSETFIAVAAALGQTLFEVANANIKRRKIAAGAHPGVTQKVSNTFVTLIAMLTVAAQFGALKGLAFAQWGLIGVMAMGITAYTKELWMEHVRKKKMVEPPTAERLEPRGGGGGRCAVFAY